MICSGNALKPLGEAFASGTIVVTATGISQGAGGQVLAGTFTNYKVDADGAYSFTLDEGFYSFDAISAEGKRTRIGTGIVGPDTIDSDLVTLIGTSPPVTDPTVFGFITPTSTDTLTNKTLSDPSNSILADGVHIRVKAGAAITKGQPVMFDSYVTGDDAIVVLPCNNATGITIGVACADIALNAFGMMMTIGNCTGLDTSAYTAGVILYPDAIGGLTATPPTTGMIQPIAVVLKVSNGNGALQINVHSPWETATNTPYDGTTSGLTATNVQAAIDELKTLAGV